ncbi:hypothetical protein [Sphaerisporangium corydalis]|uniref:Uncharacterized protein n=1 Tax=Sphaerisporangium corydalis TaxID=1441875 RepID=A0ABV9EFP0_9ACTN|nr:hypothetical protein [Sphaerisporangium corydalis]
MDLSDYAARERTRNGSMFRDVNVGVMNGIVNTFRERVAEISSMPRTRMSNGISCAAARAAPGAGTVAGDELFTAGRPAWTLHPAGGSPCRHVRQENKSILSGY